MKKTYKAKSILIGRKGRTAIAKMEDSDDRLCFIALFDDNNPHTEGKEPKEILEYTGHRIIIKNASNISYLLAGNDILINDIEEFSIEHNRHGHVMIDVRQKK